MWYWRVAQCIGSVKWSLTIYCTYGVVCGQYYAVLIWVPSVCQAVYMSPLNWGDVAFMNSRSSGIFALAEWPSTVDNSLLRLFFSCILSNCRGVTISSSSSHDGSTSRRKFYNSWLTQAYLNFLCVCVSWLSFIAFIGLPVKGRKYWPLLQH